MVIAATGEAPAAALVAFLKSRQESQRTVLCLTSRRYLSEI
jgi:hypothetical protein